MNQVNYKERYEALRIALEEIKVILYDNKVSYLNMYQTEYIENLINKTLHVDNKLGEPQ